MEAGLLTRLFGSNGEWRGPCTVILSADASVNVSGPDHLGTGGVKIYAPRLTSGRIEADAVCVLREESALMIVQRRRVRSATGEDSNTQTVTVADFDHVAALEFDDVDVLAWLGLSEPPARLRFERREPYPSR